VSLGSTRIAVCLALAAAIIAVAGGCAGVTRSLRSPRPQAPTEATTSVSAVQRANRVDIARAKKTVVAYVEALRSKDASGAAELMTSYRRSETRAKGWKAENRWWKAATVKTVTTPGRYITDERAFVQLYAEHFGHPPYKLVVVNVSYGLGPDAPLADTDFVVTQDSAVAPWLVHDSGGKLRPSAAPAP
jgi:hypothetical protein